MVNVTISAQFEHYTSVHAQAAVSLWNAAMGADFPMDLRLWRQNVDDCERTFAPGCWVALEGQSVVGLVIVKSPNHLSAIAVHPDYRRRGIGKSLLMLATDALVSDAGRQCAIQLSTPNDPPSKLITGQDYSHFFPGVPDSHDDAMAFFDACGWKKTEGWCVDLWRDLSDFAIDPHVAAKIEELAGQGIVLRACTSADVPSLFSHVEENFSARWLAETRRRVQMEPDPSEIKIAVRGGGVVGFAHTFTNRSAKLGPSVYWRGLLGGEYGGLGPIGVGKDVRKIGLGLALLSYCVNEVSNAGMTRMAIDWTVIIDFYNRAGFDVWKRYVPYIRPL